MQALFVHSEESPGPAPNSGDGVPDGSGFDQDELIKYGIYAAVVLIGVAILIAYLRARAAKLPDNPHILSQIFSKLIP